MITEEQYVKQEEEFENYLNAIMESGKCDINQVLNNDDVEKCMELSRSSEDEEALRVLVNTFNRISGNRVFNKLKYKVIMGGFIIGFNLNKVTGKNLDKYFSSNKIKIHGCKKTDINKYWLELSFRRRVMERIINEQYTYGDRDWETNTFTP